MNDNVIYTQKFLKSYRRFPLQIQNKVDKQLRFLLLDMFYPSLRTKKMEGANV